uniref:DNA replication complex GINS protein SLD5 n=1 Tax=Phaeomonas parva TaxID=124430 RepID=A0A7S1TZD8_9STRA|mmetsp:Transcript_24717/g.77505  ORF Transcript_24717/g.77505 Transcript_24717/m.77505 type:complete len:245 (+) Transcript_24717:148-882(+)
MDDALQDLLSPEEAAGAFRNEQVSQIMQAYLDENAAPELLPFRGELVAELREQLAGQEEQIAEITEGEGRTVEEVFTASLYQMDIDRVKYALAKYLRVRILKLERVAGLFRADLAPELADAAAELRRKISDEERQFAGELEKLYEAHIDDAVLRHLPEDGPETLRSLGDADICRPPRTDRFVFCRVNETVDGFLAHETAEPATWEEGDVHVAPYAAIKSFVEDGRMSLSAPHFEDPQRPLADAA